MSRILVIGGSDAGISAALRAKECDPSSDVAVVLADAFPNYSVCGIPFYLSGEVSDWHQLAHRSTQELEDAGIRLVLNHVAEAIDPVAHQVRVVGADAPAFLLSYDRLVLATGAEPIVPSIDGMGLPNVFLLRSMEDCLSVEGYLMKHAPRAVLIVGAGYIGLEMADALTRRGLSVTVVEHGPSVLKTVDIPLGTLVQAELERHGVQVIPSVAVQRLTPLEERVQVTGTNGFSQQADLVLVAVGVRPVTGLAQSAGLPLGTAGALRVNRRMETNIPDIFAAGDCVETWHWVLKHPTYLPLGSTAHKQGRVAGENAVGGSVEFAGTLGTQVVKVFDLVIARTGLRDGEARAAGFVPHTLQATYPYHKRYYPGVQPISLHLTGDDASGRLLGAQLVGAVQTEVAKRVDTLATALFHEMSIQALSDLDLSYTPPLGSPWDVVQMAAQEWERHREQSMQEH